MNPIVAYISKQGKVVETRTYDLNNPSQHKELLALLHQIACGLDKGMRITFTTEL